jgi:hypothetical protein
MGKSFSCKGARKPRGWEGEIWQVMGSRALRGTGNKQMKEEHGVGTGAKASREGATTCFTNLCEYYLRMSVFDMAQMKHT